MENSSRYQQLVTRIVELETNLLPAINMSGNYSTKEIDLTRAYCLLSHAEIEAYLEDILLEVVRAIFIFWKEDNSKIPEIIFNLACSAKIKMDKKELPTSLVHIGMKSYEEIISKNHGIKEHNIDNIFTPIGYSIDKTLVTVLHNFGDTRGDIAHQSFKTQQLIDPQTERRNIDQIISELSKFDIDFYKYKTPANNSRLSKVGRSWWQKIFCS